MEEIPKKETSKTEEIKENTISKETPAPPKKDKNIGMAVIAYILFFIPLLTEAKNEPFVKYHIKQGLALFITEIVASLVSLVPLFGWMLSPLLWLFCLVVFVMGIVNAVNGKQVPLPLIGEFGEKLNL